jgi:hypothetical protein
MNNFQQDIVERQSSQYKDVSKVLEVNNTAIIIINISKRSSLLTEGVSAIIIKDNNEVISVVQYSELTFYKDGWEYKGEIDKDVITALKKALKK